MRIGLLFAGVIQQKPEQNTHTYTQYLGWWLLSWRRDSLWNFFALFHQETFQLIDCEGRVAAQVSDAQTQQRISIYETRAGKSRGCCAALRWVARRCSPASLCDFWFHPPLSSWLAVARQPASPPPRSSSPSPPSWLGRLMVLLARSEHNTHTHTRNQERIFSEG